MIAGFLFQTLGIMTPLLLAALGGLYSERAGVLNIGLEGLILTGAFFGAIAAAASGSPFVGMMAGIAAAILLCSLMLVLVLKGGADVFIAGLGLNLLAPALCALLSRAWTGSAGVIAIPAAAAGPALHLPLIDRIPFLGTIFSGHSGFTYLAWGVGFGTIFLLNRTLFGTAMKAAGSAPELLRLGNMEPDSYRAAGLLLSAAYCGLAGASLSLSLGAYVPGESAGRGWLALAAIYLGYRRPEGVMFAVLLLAAAQALANYWQGGLGISPGLLAAFPSVVAVLGLAGYSAYRKYGARK